MTGKFTGNPYIWLQKPWFPVDFPVKTNPLIIEIPAFPPRFRSKPPSSVLSISSPAECVPGLRRKAQRHKERQDWPKISGSFWETGVINQFTYLSYNIHQFHYNGTGVNQITGVYIILSNIIHNSLGFIIFYNIIVIKVLWINIISDSISTVNSIFCAAPGDSKWISGFLSSFYGWILVRFCGEFGNFLSRRKVAFRDLLVEF